MTVTRAQVVDAARKWLGTPWRHQGRNTHGIDCVGLVVVVCKGLGISSYDDTGYGRDPDPHKFLPHFDGSGAVTGSGKSITIFSFPMLAIASMAPGDFPRRGLCFFGPVF